MNDTLLCLNLVLAAASVIMAVAALVSAYYARRSVNEQQANFARQVSEYKLALHAEAILRFEARFFDDEQFKRIRCAAGKALLVKHKEEDAEDIFDFFETVGLFVKLEALNPQMVYSVFFHWVNLYWKAGKHHIGSRRQDAASLWGDFQRLYEALCEIERRSAPDSEDLAMPESRLRKQLQEEVDLCN